MKKIFCMIVLLVVLFPLPILSQQSKFPLSGWPKGIISGGGTAGNPYYTIAVGVSELATKYLGIRGTAITGAAGSAGQITGLNIGELDFAALADMNAYWACKGIGPYEGKRVKNIRGVAGMHTVQVALLTNAKYGIKTMEDLKGTGYVVSLHIQGSSAFRSAADAIMEFYGLGPKDINSVPHISEAEAIQGLKEGRFRAIMEAGYATMPKPQFLELDSDIEMRMIPLSQKCIEYVCNKIPGFIPTVHPAAFYKGVAKEVPTVGIAAGLFCRAEIPDSLVYELCKLIFEPPTRKEWEGFAPHHKEYTAESVKYFLTPVHDGALQYYKEKGVWTEKMEKTRTQILTELGVKK